jgi:hypothetical protein
MHIKWFRRLASRISSVGASLFQTPVPPLNVAYHFASVPAGRVPIHADVECRGLIIQLDEEGDDLLVRVRSLEPRPNAARISLALIGGSDIAEVETDWRSLAYWHAIVRSSEFFRIATEHPEVEVAALLTNKEEEPIA